MLKPEEMLEMKNLMAERERQLELGNTTAAEEVQQQIEALKQRIREQESQAE
jgi:predicted lipid carrier protein YhbT